MSTKRSSRRPTTAPRSGLSHEQFIAILEEIRSQRQRVLDALLDAPAARAGTPTDSGGGPSRDDQDLR